MGKFPLDFRMKTNRWGKFSECFAEAALRWVNEGVRARLAVPKAVLFKSSLRLINMLYSLVLRLR